MCLHVHVRGVVTSRGHMGDPDVSSLAVGKN